MRSQAKAALQRQCQDAHKVQANGAALASGGSTGLLVYKGVGDAPSPNVSHEFRNALSVLHGVLLLSKPTGGIQ